MPVEPLNLDPVYCRARQQRLCEQLAAHSIDRAVIVSHENVQWLTGFRPHRLMHAAVCLEADGQCTLVAPNEQPEHAAADHIVTFEAQWHCTLRQEQLAVATKLLADTVGRQAGRLGIEHAAPSPHVLSAFGVDTTSNDRLVDLDPTLWQLRRRKDPDELAMIRRAVDCTEAMYARAREIITPGITELHVFNELHAAAVDVAGEPLVALGNDYQAGSPGGPPRDRPAQAGELFILDLGPCYRGYYADNCRTIAVSGQPTDAQQQAWEAIVAVLDMVEQTVRPGTSARDLFEQAKTILDAHLPGGFPHHLGHGFGLYPHEAPYLNPHWNDRFEEGDTFTAEPGLYVENLCAGIRLEQDYLVTRDGVERLTNFSLEL
ncbi:MAG: aminopeptidase P family protein [Planctomycetaceae bacterium]|nr:aminopeptidase P family protein [Planctomycetaceae bacterium]